MTGPQSDGHEARFTRGRHAGVVVALAIAGLVAVGVVALVRRDTTKPETLQLGSSNVISIQVVRPRGVQITIDGKRVGAAPLILHMPPTKRTLLVEAPGRTPRQIVGDHNQIVDLDSDPR